MSIKRSDSVFEEICLTGAWWLAGNRRKQVRGTLTGSVVRGYTLELEGALEEWETSSPGITIQGKAKGNEYVTLPQCYLQGQNNTLFGTAPKSSSYHVPSVLIGGLYDTWGDVRFRRVSFGLHLLEEWRCISAFNSTALYKSIVSGEPMNEPVCMKPDPEELANTRGTRVTLEYEVLPPGMSRVQTTVTIEHGTRIAVEASGDALPYLGVEDSPSDQSFAATMNHLTRFFSFAISATTFPYDILGFPDFGTRTGRKKKHRKLIRILLSLKVPHELPKRDSWRMDLQPKHFPSDPKPCIENWLDKAPSLSKPISHYLDVVCGNTEYLETQAVNLCIAIEGYHRYAHPNSGEATSKHKKQLREILSSAPTNHKRWLKERLQHSHEPSLRGRFKELFRRYPKTIEWLIGLQKERKSFINWALGRRNTYSHGIAAINDVKEDGHAFAEYYKVQILRAVLFMCLLSELGFSEMEIDAILRDNEHISQVTSRRREPRDPKKIHVRGKRGKWSVYAQGAIMSYGFKRKEEAIKKGRAMASERQGHLIIHNAEKNK